MIHRWPWTLLLVLGAHSGVYGDAASMPAAGDAPVASTRSSTDDFWLSAPDAATAPSMPARQPGYVGLWTMTGPVYMPYRRAMTGAAATYGPQIAPIACYSQKAGKTFFVYSAGVGEILHRKLQTCIGYYDHQSKTMPRPVLLCERPTDDPHGNAALTIDEQGRVWVFVSAVGDLPGEVYRSAEPYSIDAFVHVGSARFADPQVWSMGSKGLAMFCRLVDKPAGLYFLTSPDGVAWSTPRLLAGFGCRHDAVSGRFGGNKLAVAFNVLAEGGPWSGGTNLYYLESSDFGDTWQTSRRQPVELPLSAVDNPALVHDHAASGELTFPQDLNFDPQGRPLLLYLVSYSNQAGSPGNWRKYFTARPSVSDWELCGLLLADHNLDSGCIYSEVRSEWRLIAPTVVGRDQPPVAPQPYMPGGEMLSWTSGGPFVGRLWTPHWLTRQSTANHNFARRPVDASNEFYTLWCAADARVRGVSELFFATREGEVFRMPTQIAGDAAAPEPVGRAVTTSLSP